MFPVPVDIRATSVGLRDLQRTICFGRRVQHDGVLFPQCLVLSRLLGRAGGGRGVDEGVGPVPDPCHINCRGSHPLALEVLFVSGAVRDADRLRHRDLGTGANIAYSVVVRFGARRP